MHGRKSWGESDVVVEEAVQVSEAVDVRSGNKEEVRRTRDLKGRVGCRGFARTLESQVSQMRSPSQGVEVQLLYTLLLRFWAGVDVTVRLKRTTSLSYLGLTSHCRRTMFTGWFVITGCT
ncbi:hypothetical protein Z043_111045 [Scleropages formosus]|uniref:Uncharacterized protein n=1 Tax=Scleropages formosus TaxID=113540 RepID=A0A0P7V5V8_SCLFO|nr:hypothetical protein Z043_111045 [Scleropages formosus]